MISESNAGDIMESLAALKNFPPHWERAARVAIQELIEKHCESAEVGTKVRDALFERYDEWCGPASLIATIKEFNKQLEPSNERTPICIGNSS